MDLRTHSTDASADISPADPPRAMPATRHALSVIMPVYNEEATLAEVINGVLSLDLGYDPAQWAQLLEPILRGEADVVYGSRFLGEATGMRRRNRWANRGLSAMTRLLLGTGITDMETCYKLIRRSPPTARCGHPRTAHRLPSTHPRRRQEDRLERRNRRGPHAGDVACAGIPEPAGAPRTSQLR
jgi:hypothetical protein